MSLYLDLNKDLTPTQVTLKEETHRFAAEVLRPASMELDKIADPEEVIKEGSLFWDVFKKAYNAGFHIRGFDESMGGANLGPLEQHIVTEEMGWGSADFAIALGCAPFPFAFTSAVCKLTGNQEMMDELVVPFARDREA